MRFYCREAQQPHEITIKRSLALSAAVLMNTLRDRQKCLPENSDTGIPSPTTFTRTINPIGKIAQNSCRIIGMTFMLSL